MPSVVGRCHVYDIVPQQVALPRVFDKLSKSARDNEPSSRLFRRNLKDCVCARTSHSLKQASSEHHCPDLSVSTRFCLKIADDDVWLVFRKSPVNQVRSI